MKISKILLAFAVAGLAVLGQARADLASQYIWANGQSYGVFALDGGLGASSFTNGAVVNGATALGPGFASGGIAVTLNSDAGSGFNGNIYYSPNSLFTGTQTITPPYGKVQQSSSLMQTQDNNAVAAGISFKNLAAASNYTSSNTRLFSSSSANMSLTGNQTLTLTSTGGESVLKLNNFTVSSSTIDLVGSASSSFVFDITGLYSLNKANIVLSGGLTAGNVIFNLIGASPTSAGAGTSAYYSLYNSTVNGSILAPNRTISILNNSLLNGIAVGQQVIVDNSTVNQIPNSQ